MTLRILANKLWLLLATLTVATWQLTPLAAYVPAEWTAKVYFYDNYNQYAPAQKSILTTLGIKDFNDYLSNLDTLDEVVVAVVDTGLDVSQAVFTNRVYSEYGIDFSSSLQPEMYQSWAIDENGHGTHVAGIIADSTLPNVKILPIRIFAGVGNETVDDYAFDNAVRYITALATGEKTTLLTKSGLPQRDAKNRLVYYNSDEVHLNIVACNLSLGTRGYRVDDPDDMAEFQQLKYGTSKSSSYQSVIDNLIRANVLPIVAAGNINGKNGESNRYAYYSLPAACDGVLAVSAYDNTDETVNLASFSYYNDFVSLSAPGAAIWSACSQQVLDAIDWKRAKKHTDQYGTYYTYNYSSAVNWTVRQDESGFYMLRSSGTSMATPFVTACYAMLMSDNSRNTTEDYGLGEWTAEDDKYYLTLEHKALLATAATYADFGGEEYVGYDQYYGYGGVNVLGFNISDDLQEIDNKIPVTNLNHQDNPSNPEAAGQDWTNYLWLIGGVLVLIWAYNIFKPQPRRRETDE